MTDRATLSKILSLKAFPVAAHSLRRWPLCVTKVSGRALYDVEEALAVAEARLNSSPRYRQAGTATTPQHDEGEAA